MEPSAGALSSAGASSLSETSAGALSSAGASSLMEPSAGALSSAGASSLMEPSAEASSSAGASFSSSAVSSSSAASFSSAVSFSSFSSASSSASGFSSKEENSTPSLSTTVSNCANGLFTRSRRTTSGTNVILFRLSMTMRSPVFTSTLSRAPTGVSLNVPRPLTFTTPSCSTALSKTSNIWATNLSASASGRA